MQTILSDLHEEDFFGLVVFSDKITTWRDSLSKATKQNVTDAKLFVANINDDGSEY